MTLDIGDYEALDEYAEYDDDPDDLDDIESLIEDLEPWDEEDGEFIGPLLIGKAASSLFGKRRRPKAPRASVPSGRLAYGAGSSNALRVTTNRIAADIKKLSRTSARNHARSVANQRRSSANTTAARKLRSVSNRQAKQIKKVDDRLNQVQQTSLITTLLSSGGKKEYEIKGFKENPTNPNDPIGAVVEVSEKSDSLDLMLPLMLSGGFGASGGSGFDNPMMLILMMKALGDDT